MNPAPNEEGWLNDPCGLVYFDEEYHTFAQRWAHCWLHWVSKDLIHWTEFKPAFYEAKKYACVQSGSCVVDKTNVAGLGKNAMIAFWPSGPFEVTEPNGLKHANQNICYSTDHGRTWMRYDKNPVLKDSERDPRVFWYEPGKKWIMVLHVNKEFAPAETGTSGFAFYSSKDLLNWQKMSFATGYFEMPDFFQLPVDGDPKNMKWVLVGGDMLYTYGNFDGTTYTTETKPKQKLRNVFGNCYADQTFNNMEDADGRRIQMAWARSGDYPKYISYTPDMPFNQQLTFPVELSLKTYDGAVRLFRNPIKEVEKLHLAEHKLAPQTVAAGGELKIASGELLHIKADLTMPNGAEAMLNIRGEIFTIANGYVAYKDDKRNVQKAQFTDDSGGKKWVPGALKSLEILVDRVSIEIFVNGGELEIIKTIPLTENAVKLQCTKGEVKLSSLTSYDLDTIWKDKPLNP